MQTLAEYLGSLDTDQPKPVEQKPLKVTVKDFCRGIIESPEYRMSISHRITLGTLPPAVETMIWDRAYGKTIEKVEIKDTTDPLEDFTIEQLQDRARRLLAAAQALSDGEPEMTTDERDGSVH